MLKKICLPFFICLCFVLIGCGGTRTYSVQDLAAAEIQRQLPGTVNIKTAMETTYFHEIGLYNYELNLEEGVQNQYAKSLGALFQEGLKADTAETNIIITALDTSIFPIAGIIIDVRLFFRVEIFDEQMEKQKTVMIYGFGSDEDGNVALSKAITNSFYQLLPELEEMFVQ